MEEKELEEEEEDSFESCSSSDDNMGYGLFNDESVKLQKDETKGAKASGCYGGGEVADDGMIEMLQTLLENEQSMEEFPLIVSQDALEAVVGSQKVNPLMQCNKCVIIRCNQMVNPLMQCDKCVTI